VTVVAAGYVPDRVVFGWRKDARALRLNGIISYDHCLRIDFCPHVNKLVLARRRPSPRRREQGTTHTVYSSTGRHRSLVTVNGD